MDYFATFFGLIHLMMKLLAIMILWTTRSENALLFLERNLVEKF